MFDYVAILVFAIGLLALIGWRLWRRTGEMGFPIGFLLLYYGTLHGAWSILVDKTGGDSGRGYIYLEAKLFPIALDDDYLTALALYTLFLVSAAIAVYLNVRSRKDADESRPDRLRLHHGRLLSMSAVAGVLSFLLVRNRLAAADLLGISGYTALRSDELPRFHTIFQELSLVALLPLAIGIATLSSGNDAVRVHSIRRGGLWIVYLIMLVGLMTYFALLGFRSYLVQAGLLGGLLYVTNCRRPAWMHLATVGLALLGALGVIEQLRGLAFSELASGGALIDPAMLLRSVGESTEQFAAHFSMYGALHQNVPVTGGSSFVALVASAVPRDLWPGRPLDIYSHYASGVSATAGQGYTVHHATGWFLNFGTLGVAIGGVVMGFLWALFQKLSAHSRRGSSRFALAFHTLAFVGFTSMIFTLLRGGPEAYKSVAIDGLLLPVAVLAMGSTVAPEQRTAR